MTQNYKDILLKELSARIPYDVFVNINDIKCILQPHDISDFIKCDMDIKPYLYPLTSMTDEQYKKFVIISGWDVDIDDVRRGKFSCIGYIGLDYLYDAIDWFNKNHFDYRGLIPMGLAIDATGLDIYDR